MMVACGPDIQEERKSRLSENVRLFNKLSSEESGLNFENRIVENNRINILNYLYYYNGSGVAIGDVNNDGLPDIYMAATVGKNKLFLNKGNLKFEDISIKANVEGGFGITTGVSFIDVNNDGFLDIYVCKSGVDSKTYRKNQLFINDGNLKFQEKAAEYGLDDHSFSNQAYFFDMDLDGDLDMYLVNHPVDWPNMNKIMTGKQELDGFSYQFSDKLYQNNGENGFEDITINAGIQNRSWGLSAAVGDYNGDNLLDIYVANDFIKPDNLYINQGNGTFRDEIKTHFQHISFFSMGSDFADINNDGLNDLFVADMAMPGHSRSKKNMGSMSTSDFKTIIKRGYHVPYASNTLQLNVGNNKYVDIAQMSHVNKTDWSWSPLLVDLDNDGFKDLMVTNGIYRDIIDNDFLLTKATYDKNPQRNYFDDLVQQIPQSKVSNFIFKNEKDLTFKKINNSWGITNPTNSNGAAYADLDLDGDLDFITNNLNEPSFIHENLAADSLSNNYLKVKLKGPAKNTGAIGAKVEISYDNTIQRLDVQPTRGYLSSVDYTLHFGLGNYKGEILLKISWPDGKTTSSTINELNKSVSFDYTDKDFNDIPEKASTKPFFVNATDELQLDHQHEEVPYDDFDNEILLPHKLSENGPFISNADVNNDGKTDFYIGGSAGNPGALYLQKLEGGFESCSVNPWFIDRKYEDQMSLFFDADNDGDMDLYVVSGSNEFEDKSLYQDRLYINDGAGNFEYAKSALPTMNSSGLAVAGTDFDKDGDVDLVVGGRVVPSQYPTAPRSFLLENIEGKFHDVTQEKAPELQNIGMITDLIFSDYDGDNDEDLILVGEWLPITVLENSRGQFKLTTENLGLKDTDGWWFSLASGDIDNDGDIDYAVGNIGLNNKYQPTQNSPLHIYYNDFDQNGKGDIVLSKTEGGVDYPIRGRECSAQQVPKLEKDFPSFKSFATASLQHIYADKYLADALHYEAKEFASCLLINDGTGAFEIRKLPSVAQISPLMGIEFHDINQDGNLDLVAAGNFHGTETETIRYDAGVGICMLGDGKGNFLPKPVNESGIYLDGDVKDLDIIDYKKGTKAILSSATNGKFEILISNNR